LLRYGWLAMFLIGIVGATFLVGLFRRRIFRAIRLRPPPEPE
jgi:hypothetical protein